jgi:hypothetical protein
MRGGKRSRLQTSAVAGVEQPAADVCITHATSTFPSMKLAWGTGRAWDRRVNFSRISTPYHAKHVRRSSAPPATQPLPEELGGAGRCRCAGRMGGRVRESPARPSRSAALGAKLAFLRDVRVVPGRCKHRRRRTKHSQAAADAGPVSRIRTVPTAAADIFLSQPRPSPRLSRASSL